MKAQTASQPGNAGVNGYLHSVFAIGFAFATINTAISAMQPVIMRYAALNIDPLVFCAGAVGFAACGAVVMLAWSGELRILVNRTYLPWLFGVSMAGTVATSLTLIYGLEKIDAVAGVILLESEPVYSLLMATVFLGERPSIRQLLATATILAGIGSVMGAGRAFTPFYAAALVFVTPTILANLARPLAAGDAAIDTTMHHRRALHLRGHRTVRDSGDRKASCLVAVDRIEGPGRRRFCRAVRLPARFADLVRSNQPPLPGVDDGVRDSGSSDPFVSVRDVVSR